VLEFIDECSNDMPVAPSAPRPAHVLDAR